MSLVIPFAVLALVAGALVFPSKVPFLGSYFGKISLRRQKVANDLLVGYFSPETAIKANEYNIKWGLSGGGFLHAASRTVNKVPGVRIWVDVPTSIFNTDPSGTVPIPEFSRLGIRLVLGENLCQTGSFHKGVSGQTTMLVSQIQKIEFFEFDLYS